MLKTEFGIETIKDLAKWKYFRIAKNILAASKYEHLENTVISSVNIGKAVTNTKLPLQKLVKSKVDVLRGN